MLWLLESDERTRLRPHDSTERTARSVGACYYAVLVVVRILCLRQSTRPTATGSCERCENRCPDAAHWWSLHTEPTSKGLPARGLARLRGARIASALRSGRCTHCHARCH